MLKKSKGSPVMRFRCEDDSEENGSEYGSEDDDEEEDGQIMIPDGIIMEDINDIKPEANYQLVYVRLKSEEEQQAEKDVS